MGMGMGTTVVYGISVGCILVQGNSPTLVKEHFEKYPQNSWPDFTSMMMTTLSMMTINSVRMRLFVHALDQCIVYQCLPMIMIGDKIEDGDDKKDVYS